MLKTEAQHLEIFSGDVPEVHTEDTLLDAEAEETLEEVTKAVDELYNSVFDEQGEYKIPEGDFIEDYTSPEYLDYLLSLGDYLKFA